MPAASSTGRVSGINPNNAPRRTYIFCLYHTHSPVDIRRTSGKSPQNHHQGFGGLNRCFRHHLGQHLKTIGEMLHESRCYRSLYGAARCHWWFANSSDSLGKALTRIGVEVQCRIFSMETPAPNLGSSSPLYDSRSSAPLRDWLFGMERRDRSRPRILTRILIFSEGHKNYFGCEVSPVAHQGCWISCWVKLQ